MPDYEYEYEYEHDLDRTQREFESAVHELQPEHFEIAGEEEYFAEAEAASRPYDAGSYRASSQHQSPEAEELELELAAELLEITSEEELDRFLGDVFKKVGGFVSGAVKSPVFKALGSVIKPIAKAALPIAGGALGTFVGGPAGAMIGSKLGSAAGNLLGLELEGLSAEDREFEMAKGFVRLASGAAEEVKNMRFRPGENPVHAAKAAVMRAGQRVARGEPISITENIDITTGAARRGPHAPAPGPHAPVPGPHPMVHGPHATAHGAHPAAPGWSENIDIRIDPTRPGVHARPHDPHARVHGAHPAAPGAHPAAPGAHPAAHGAHAPAPGYTEDIDITIDPSRPGAHARPHDPHARHHGLHARQHGLHPAAHAAHPAAPGAHPAAPGPHATADGWSHPGATSGTAGGAHPGAPISGPSSFDSHGAPPESHGDSYPESIPAGAKRQGTWFRRGRRIILMGV
jgi:hypothetical protein